MRRLMPNFRNKLFFYITLYTFLITPANFDFLKSNTQTITDWARITTVSVQKIIAPTTIGELQNIVRKASEKKQKISILGAGYSQGGQTAYKNGIVIDMRNFKSITNFDIKNQKITVQAGVTWQEIQKYIDPYNLSIKAMQSYYNFSVGGSLSVNVHGRNNKYGQIIETVESIKIVLADGSLINANRQENYDIFRAAIGGYGYLGIIVEATLSLTQNSKMARKVVLMPAKNYKKFFFDQIHDNPEVIMHNGNLYPNDFNKVLSITWYKTNEDLTIKERLLEPGKVYPKELIGMQILRRVNATKKLRAKFEPKILNTKTVVMRNFIMADDTKSLQPLLTFPTSHILQEYFIPCDQFDRFVKLLRNTINDYNVNVINCSIRYVKKNTESILSYASKDSFSFVLYINILNTDSGKKATQKWTQELIDNALICGGTFYLPYQLSARKDQLLKAYPNFKEFLKIKNHYDPQSIFSNELFRKYN